MDLSHHVDHEEALMKPKGGLLRSDGTTIVCESTRELVRAYEHDVLQNPLKRIITTVSHAVKRTVLFG